MIEDLQPWLLKTLAFYNVTPWDDYKPLPDKLLASFEDEEREIRLMPEVDAEKAMAEFLKAHA